MDDMQSSVENNRGVRKPYSIYLPFLSSDTELGLGDVIKRTTSRLGIQPCDSCNRRASRLNGLLVFSGSTSSLAHEHITPRQDDLQRSISSMERTRSDAACSSLESNFVANSSVIHRLVF